MIAATTMKCSAFRTKLGTETIQNLCLEEIRMLSQLGKSSQSSCICLILPFVSPAQIFLNQGPSLLLQLQNTKQPGFLTQPWQSCHLPHMVRCVLNLIFLIRIPVSVACGIVERSQNELCLVRLLHLFLSISLLWLALPLRWWQTSQHSSSNSERLWVMAG